MNIFYEDGGSLKVASIVQKNDATYQADTQHGKRVKIKAANAFIEFDGDMEAFLAAAQSEAAEIDTALLWEAVGEDEFSAEHAATEYFGNQPSKIQLAATFIALYAAPMYFHKKGKKQLPRRARRHLAASPRQHGAQSRARSANSSVGAKHGFRLPARRNRR